MDKAQQATPSADPLTSGLSPDVPSTLAMRFEFNAITHAWMLAMTDSQSGEVVRKINLKVFTLWQMGACISLANGLTGSFDQIPQSPGVIFSSQPSTAHAAMTSITLRL